MTVFLIFGLMLLALACSVYMTREVDFLDIVKKRGERVDKDHYGGMAFLAAIPFVALFYSMQYLQNYFLATEGLGFVIEMLYPALFAGFLVSLGVKLYNKYYPSSNEELRA